ncbi:GAF domain-containing protein [Jatrophihabitans fulvus]
MTSDALRAPRIVDDPDTVWFPVDDHAAGSARQHVATVLASWGIDDVCAGDAELLVSELVTNVVRYTGSRTVGVNVRATERMVIVGVRETAVTATPGPRTTMLADFAPPPGPGDDAVHGRGLRILDALATEWGITRTNRYTGTWFALTPDTPPPLRALSVAAAAQLDAVQSSLARTQLLLRITESLGDAVTADQVGTVITRHLRDHLDAVFTGIALIVPGTAGEDAMMRYLDLSAFPESTRAHWARFPYATGAPVAAAAATRTGLFHESRDAADADFPGIGEHMATAGTGAMAHVPLLAAGTCLGTLALAWSQPRVIDADTRALLTIVAGYAAHALHRHA